MLTTLILRIFLGFILFTIVSCEPNILSNGSLFTPKPMSQKASFLADTLFLSNDSLVLAQLVDEGKGAVLQWGVTNKFWNVGKDTLPYSQFSFNHFSKEDNLFLIKQGCGTACNYIYIALFTPTHKGRLFLYPLFLDPKRGVIVYQGDNYDTLVVIENIITEKSQSIKEEFDKTRRPYSAAIDTTYLIDNELYLKWKQANNASISKVFDVRNIQ
ncbi:MAG: hypothetical protein IPG32_01680 [Saprospirales bacterium]|nr:hypothetical protein [Saprospirales bacterium]